MAAQPAKYGISNQRRYRADDRKAENPVRISTAWSAAAAFVCLSFGVAIAQVNPGDVIDKSNVAKIKDLACSGLIAAVENGSELNIVPYKKIPVSPIYTQATEKYAAQATLDDKNDLKNWVAGQPFPKIDPSDPKAAVKVMWNFQRNPVTGAFCFWRSL